MEDLATRVHTLLLDRHQSVACAESLTGGELAARLSSTPGSSATFRGGLVCYATEVKRTVLGVTAESVVSAECAEQLATGVRRLLGSDWAVSATGVAGPDRQEDQPVGTVFVGIAGPGGTSSIELSLVGDRAAIRRETCTAALRRLVDELG